VTDSSNRITLTMNGEHAQNGIALEVVKIHAVAEHEQTALFTGAPLPLDQLMERQAVHGPQRLAAFADSEWQADDESERFLEAIFAEND